MQNNKYNFILKDINNYTKLKASKKDTKAASKKGIRKPDSIGNKKIGRSTKKQSGYVADIPAVSVLQDAMENYVITGSYQNPSYHSQRSFAVAAVVLGQPQGKPESRMTALEKMDVAQSGVSKKDLEKLKNKTSLDYGSLAKALSVTRATLINKKGKAKFNPVLSERIVGLADIYSYGYEVFENDERFNKWMSSPNQALGGKPPFELVNSQFGREEVRNIIGRIDYGVYS
jgi:putative toxin-antitoxin system antitoxin component (TIGR02293 family)